MKNLHHIISNMNSFVRHSVDILRSGIALRALKYFIDATLDVDDILAQFTDQIELYVARMKFVMIFHISRQ